MPRTLYATLAYALGLALGTALLVTALSGTFRLGFNVAQNLAIIERSTAGAPSMTGAPEPTATARSTKVAPQHASPGRLVVPPENVSGAVLDKMCGKHRQRTALERIESRPLPWPSAILGAAGAESHDPDVLLTRALRLHKEGIGITLDRRTVSEKELTEALKEVGLSIQPLRRFGEVVGFVVDDPQQRGFLRKLGIESGDLITAVNGHELGAPEVALEAYSQAKTRRKAMIELIREERRVALYLQIL